MVAKIETIRSRALAYFSCKFNLPCCPIAEIRTYDSTRQLAGDGVTEGPFDNHHHVHREGQRDLANSAVWNTAFAGIVS